jgi:hypothetical protein
MANGALIIVIVGEFVAHHVHERAIDITYVHISAVRQSDLGRVLNRYPLEVGAAPSREVSPHDVTLAFDHDIATGPASTLCSERSASRDRWDDRHLVAGRNHLAPRHFLAIYPDPTARQERSERRRIATRRLHEKLFYGARLEAVFTSARGFAGRAEETE